MSAFPEQKRPPFEASLLSQLARFDKALAYYRHLADIPAFVDRQAASRITLHMVARAVGLSQSQLSRIFQEKVGISFHRWLTLRRLHAAMELMRERQLSAAEAAYLSGFASYRSFTRTFRKFVGTTPSKYRKQVEENLSWRCDE